MGKEFVSYCHQMIFHIPTRLHNKLEIELLEDQFSQGLREIFFICKNLAK